MKKLIAIGLAVALVLTLGVTPVFAGNGNGNGAPSGQHYNLNIIGVPNDRDADWTGGNGSRIFVSRTGTTTFYVHGGTSYQILDHNGTDGYVGTDRLDPGIIFPYDATETEHTWRVEIYVRLVGPNDPGNKTDWTTYKWDGSTYVPYETFTLNKSSKFSLKTGKLLANQYQDMLWEMDPDTKFRICQMRIYLLD